MENKVLVCVLVVLTFCCTPGWLQQRPPPRVQDDRTGPPRPFSFNYNAVNRDEGSTNYHRAEGDSAGTVRGTYGYSLGNGLYRIVEYVADENGYRATVHTNEPGVGHGNPADVNMIVEPVPEAVAREYGHAGQAGRQSG